MCVDNSFFTGEDVVYDVDNLFTKQLFTERESGTPVVTRVVLFLFVSNICVNKKGKSVRVMEFKRSVSSCQIPQVVFTWLMGIAKQCH